MLRGMLSASIFALAISFAGNPLHASAIWSDSFESGNFSSWTSANGNWAVVASALSAHTGTRGADVKGNTAPDDDTLSAGISSVGFGNLQFQYWYKVRESLDDADSVFAEWTQNGTDWLALAHYTNAPAGDWQYASFALPAEANDNSGLGFRLRAALSSTGDRMNFDDIALVGESLSSVPEPSSILSGACLAGSLLLRRRR